MRRAGTPCHRLSIWQMRAFFVLLWTLVARPINAQMDQVETLVTEGIELRVNGHDAEALDRFRAAATLAPNSPRVQGHLALALHAQGHWVESERVMLRVLDSPQDDWVARHTDELRHSLQAVQAHLGWLEIHASAPAELWLDEQLVGSTPLSAPLRVAAGQHTVSVRPSGRAPLRKIVAIPPDRHVYLDLTAGVPDRPVENPAAPPPQTPERQGTQALRTGAWGRTLGIALLGAGAAVVASGIVLGVNAIVVRGERDSECDQSGCTRDGIALDARARQSAEYSNIAIATGFVSLGVGTVLVW